MTNNYSRDNNIKTKKRVKSKAAKVKNKTYIITFRIILAAVLITGFALMGGAVGAYIGIIKNAPEMGEAVSILPDIYTTIFYDAKTGQEIDRLKGEEIREYVKMDKIPKVLRDAFVAIEDERFYSHNGIDVKGMFRALYVNLTDPNRNEGASTITQQLIKNNRKLSTNTLETKLQEQYLAVKYEKDLESKLGSKKAAKDHILEVYLNTIGLHYNLNGVQTAANYYFDKEASELTLSESAVIAAITQHPVKYNPVTKQQNNAQRRKLVLDKMLELEMITNTEYKEALADDVYTRITQNEKVTAEKTSYHSYFIDQTIKEILRDLQDSRLISSVEATNMLYNSGLQVFVTQDQEMQKIVDEAYMDDSLFPESIYEIEVQYDLSTKNTITGKEQHFRRTGTVKKESEIDGFIESVKNELVGQNDIVIAELPIPIPQPQSGMVIIDYHTGQVKAISGGRGEKLANRTLNRATDSERQPGSVFKVLASYAPALDLGLVTAATTYDDAKVVYKEYDNYTPKNWNGKYLGLTTVRDGIRNSMNILAVKNLMNTGLEPSIQYLKNFGLTTLVDGEYRNGKYFTDKVPALALGGITDGVTQLEVTAAYGTIANLGEYNKPIFYTQVLDHNGAPILENTLEPVQVLKKPTAYILTDMMTDVVKSGTGTQARFRKISMPLAGKTGTTTDAKDLTFVGYTPYYVAGMYLGFDQPKEIYQDDGSHLRLWRTIMEQIHEDLPAKDFEKPEGLVYATVCKLSGLVPSPDRCGNVHREIFAAGTQPTKYCTSHESDVVPEEELDENDQPINSEEAATPSPSVRIIDENYYLDEQGQLHMRTPNPAPSPTPAQNQSELPNTQQPAVAPPPITEAPATPALPQETAPPPIQEIQTPEPAEPVAPATMEGQATVD